MKLVWKPILIAGIVLSGIMLISIAAFLLATPDVAFDFATYRVAAVEYLRGQSPYAGRELQHLYLYPPAFLAIIVPFAVLPSGVGLVLWDGLQFLLLYLALAWALRDHLSKDHLALLLAFLPLWYPAIMGLRFGQVAGILLIGWLLFGYYLQRGNDLRAGLWLTLLAIKPPLLLVPLCLLLFLRRGRALVGVLIGGLIWLLVSLAMLGPQGLLDYLRTLSVAAGAQSSDAVYQTSTYSWGSVANLLPSQGWLVLLVLDGMTVALVLRLAHERSVEDALAIATPAMLLASPHVLVYDLLPLVATLPVLLRRGRALIVFALVTALVAVPAVHSFLGAPQIVSVLMCGLMLGLASTSPGRTAT